MSDLATVVRDLTNCSSKVGKLWVIEADMDSENLSFRGAILGGIGTPIWGSVIHFNLQLDPGKLSEPPKVSFSPNIIHPFIEPVYGAFCFPVTACALSSRMDMEKFLDTLVDLFLLKDTFNYAVNMDAARSFWTSPDKFWALIRNKANATLKNGT